MQRLARGGTSRPPDSDLTPGEQVADPLRHHQMLHVAPHGTVIYWQRHSKQRWLKVQPSDLVEQLVSKQAARKDRYLTVQQFHGWRYVRLLKSLRCCYVDVDNCTDLPSVLEALDDQQLPHPSFAVYSGNGLHLYWLLEPTPAKALPVWQRMQDRLIRALEVLGADTRARDCTRVLRVAGSVHSGADVVAEGRILSGERWPFSLLANEVLGERKPGHERRGKVRDIRTRQRTRSVSGGIYQRWHLVYRDLIRIAEAQWWGGIPEGYRDTWVFLAANSLSWFAHPDAILYEIEAEAKRWTSLRTNEVRSAISTVVRRAQQAADGKTIQWQSRKIDPRYRFRRSTLWSWCEGMIPQEIVPELRAIVPDEVAQQRKRERDRARWRDSYTGEGHSASRAADAATARLMLAQGYSQRAIARELEVNQSTVSRWLKQG